MVFICGLGDVGLCPDFSSSSWLSWLPISVRLKVFFSRFEDWVRAGGDEIVLW